MNYNLSKNQFKMIMENEKKKLLIFKIFSLIIIIILSLLSFFSVKQIIDMLIYTTPRSIIFIKVLLELFFINVGFCILDILLTSKNKYYENLKNKNINSYLVKITNKESNFLKYYFCINLEKEIKISTSLHKYGKVKKGDEAILIINLNDNEDTHLYTLDVLK